MNKKKIILMLAGILVAVCVLEILSFGSHDPNARSYYIVTDEFTFDARKYSAWINLYPDGVSVGPITDAKDAVNKAVSLWSEESVARGSGFDALHKQPYYALHDAENQCWRISATIPDNVFGATPLALILDDGTVLAVWYQ